MMEGHAPIGQARVNILTLSRVHTNRCLAKTVPPAFPSSASQEIAWSLRKGGHSFSLQAFRITLPPSSALAICLLPPALFLPSPVRMKKSQINTQSAWFSFQNFPGDLASETRLSTLLCTLQASNNSPQAPGILIQRIPAKAQHTDSCLGQGEGGGVCVGGTEVKQTTDLKNLRRPDKSHHRVYAGHSQKRNI